MEAYVLLLLVGLSLSACSGPQRVERKWVFRTAPKSAFAATLVESNYNAGESNEYHLRVDAKPAGDNGWFFIDDLPTGLIISPKPDLQWTSATDLIVTVHTAEIDGQTQHSFGGNCHPPGSLTVRYIADQPKQ